jgi:thymidylate synthase (FAD)
MRVQVLDHGYVEFIEHWGSDERIIEAARMSTNKGFLGWGPKHHTGCALLYGHSGPNACDCPHDLPGDEKLLKYLYENRHDTPFEMAGMVIEVQAPIFVFREWHRHRTQSYNEMSGRYTEIPEVFYVPSDERMRSAMQSKTNKQSSGDGLDEYVASVSQQEIAEVSAACFEAYRNMLCKGVAREIARLVLPVNTYSRMRASANLRNWLAFLTLRDSPKAQIEIQQFAHVVAELVQRNFPRTYELYVGGRK